MERAFQTAITVLQPDAVIVLGDVTNEGKWCGDREWQDTMQRYLSHYNKMN